MSRCTQISLTCGPTRRSRRTGGAGGSPQIVPHRKRKERCNRNENARQQVTEKLGTEEVARLLELWDRMENVQREHAQADGIIVGLIKRGLSQIETRSLLKIGGSRFQRIEDAVREGVALEAYATRRRHPTPKHAATHSDIDAIHAHAQSFSLEDGYPCSHRRPIQYFSEPGKTWLQVHSEYAAVQQFKGARVLSLSRWRQYIGFYYPGLRLTRSKEDACDACVRLDIQLQRTDLQQEERDGLLQEKRMHLDAAIDQRRFVPKFAKGVIHTHAPEQNVPAVIIPDTLDIPGVVEGHDISGECAVKEAVNIDTIKPSSCRPPRIQMQIEDYGGSFALPHYGFERPSADYFQSNLTMQNFVIPDLTNEVNHVMLYDERGQGKGADALCSLRLRHHLAIAKQDTPPEILLMVLDNCVGQNKSQCVFQFYAALSLLFYKKIVLLFLLPGHSRNHADRVVAYCRNAIRKRNAYDPSTIADIWNDVKTVKAEFLSHTDGQRPFYIGWEVLLSKYFMEMPPQYTRSFFFEIDGGLCSMRHLCSSPDEDAAAAQLIRPDNADDIRRALVKDLWGSDSVSLKEASITALKLTRTPNTELPQKKLESLATKYFSIPPEYLSYYPQCVSRALCDSQ